MLSGWAEHEVLGRWDARQCSRLVGHTVLRWVVHPVLGRAVSEPGICVKVCNRTCFSDSLQQLKHIAAPCKVGTSLAQWHVPSKVCTARIWQISESRTVTHGRSSCKQGVTMLQSVAVMSSTTEIRGMRTLQGSC